MSASPTCYAAVDIGASSGRVVIGWVNAAGTIELSEVHRFDNIQKRIDGHDCWDIDMLFAETVRGLAAARTAGFEPKTIGIDTWGVDFVLLDAQKNLIGSAVAYRDERTQGIYPLADAIMDPDRVYHCTGIQRQPFNTLYQLLALRREHPEQLAAAEHFLMISDYLAFRLTGVMVNEYTNASTTSLLNARTKDWDEEILATFGLDAQLFEKVVMPGANLGPVLPEIADELGYCPNVIVPATHDTGSAYLAVPARDEDAVFLSSGTWSLLGIENQGPITSDASRLQNFTNEGGYEGRFRFLKNIMGLWMIQSIRRELNGLAYVEGKQPANGGASDAAAGGVTGAEAGATSENADADAGLSGANDTATSDAAAASERAHYNLEYEACITPGQVGFGDLIEAAQSAEPFAAIINVNDDRLLAPDSMIDEVCRACARSGQEVPRTIGQLMRCVYLSLARCYARSIEDLSVLTGRPFTSINVVGGGSQDGYLAKLTTQACGIPVFAGPTEGTSLGNLAVQMIADGLFDDVAHLRRAIAESFDVIEYEPHIQPKERERT